MIKNEQKKIDNLIRVITNLKTTNESWRFLRDLMTENELREFANRWQAAQMLSQNIPYTKITKETGLSSTTVARVSEWLKNGMNGYKKVIQQSHHRSVKLREKRL